jgi:GNAT superfamily N-acetyltransferase
MKNMLLDICSVVCRQGIEQHAAAAMKSQIFLAHARLSGFSRFPLPRQGPLHGWNIIIEKPIIAAFWRLARISPCMLTYRTFRNTDPPILTSLWRSRAGQPGLLQPISASLLEQLVFAKPYFDYAGLILAFQDQQPVGFAHAGFGPNEQFNALSYDLGVISLVLVRPDCEPAEVAAGLLTQGELYLRNQDAKVLYGGGLQPLNPFYLGLYGGSEFPGVLDSDAVARHLFESHGYHEIERTKIMQIELSGFESVIDRRQMQIRRQMVVEEMFDAPTRNWWQACTLGEFELTRFEMVPRSGGPVVASATFRSLEPSGISSPGRRSGLIEFFVDPAYRRRGYAIFLISEVFRQFLRQGISAVEAQVMESNTPALNLYEKLGFQSVAQGSVYRKG